MDNVLNISNVNIGLKLRARRKLLGFSPHTFANLIGVSHQQLNKYETGQNRISAAMLAKISKLLNVNLEYFMKDSLIPIDFNLNDSYRASQLAEQPETIALVKNYIAIADPRVRTAIVELVTSVTKYISKKA